MSDKDFSVNAVSLLPTPGKLNNKPSYLISLTNKSKTKPIINFITTDRPDIQVGFIAVKGIYCDQNEEVIAAKFNEILTNTPKETFLDLLLPIHRVQSIRNLMFNAHKPATQLK